MAVRTKDELLGFIKERFGEDTTDETISFVEDITDTLNNYDSRNSVNWEQKYKDNDEAWRKKYRDRFFNSSTQSEEDEDEDEQPKPLTYENLFKEG